MQTQRDILSKIIYGTDMRSLPGMFVRGKPIYREASHSAKQGPTGKQIPSRGAIARRIKRRGNVT